MDIGADQKSRLAVQQFGAARGVDSEEGDAERGRAAYGSGDGVGNVVEFEVEKDLFAAGCRTAPITADPDGHRCRPEKQAGGTAVWSRSADDSPARSEEHTSEFQSLR